jgi:hypothetical protein
LREFGHNEIVEVPVGACSPDDFIHSAVMDCIYLIAVGKAMAFFPIKRRLDDTLGEGGEARSLDLEIFAPYEKTFWSPEVARAKRFIHALQNVLRLFPFSKSFHEGNQFVPGGIVSHPFGGCQDQPNVVVILAERCVAVGAGRNVMRFIGADFG